MGVTGRIAGKGRGPAAAVRAVLLGAMVILLGLAVVVRTVPADAAGPCGPPVMNPIACENTNAGTPSSQWDITGSGDPTIQGFATDISVNRGDTVFFKISTPASAYTITIYRMGFYQGNGARQIAALTPSVPLPQSQPGCLTNPPTGLVDCGNWAVSASWTVPSTVVSGIYFARLQRTDTGGSSHIMFVVRDDASHSDLLFQTSDTTWQAYNQYGGDSLYLGSAPSSDGRAYKVSYNRPFATRGQATGYGTSNWVFYGEYPMVRFLEANGYDLSYSSGVDTDRRGALIKNHKVFLSVGHDEYWSAGQRANVEAARAAGVNLAFFSGNESFWKVRWENSIDGSATPYRTLVSYKETKSTTPIDPQDPPTWTGTWRDPTWSPPADGGRPENAMTGTIFTVNRGSAAITVPSAYSKLRFWRNTSVASLGQGQTATLGSQTLGYEWDEDLDNGFRPAGDMDLSSTTVNVTEHLVDYGNTYTAATVTHHLTLYRSPAGGLVFGAGTVQWSWGLDVNHDTSPDIGPSTPDSRMQQATVNVLADMGAQPATLQAGLVAATPSTDLSRPSSTITSPAAGSTVQPGASVSITGTAADTGGGVVAGVEVSVDGGGTWHPASGTASWSYSWTVGRPGTAVIMSRAVDDSGNLETPSAGISVTIAGSPLPAFNSVSTVTNGTSVVRPAGVIAGDLLLAELEVDADPVTVSGPPSWARLLDTTVALGGGSAFHGQVWYKVATANEPSSYTWSVSGNTYVDIAVMDYFNVSKTSPIDASAGRDAGSTATPATSSVVTTVSNDRLVALFANYNTGTWTAGSGMTKRYDFDSNSAEDALQAAAGATGAKTITNTVSGPTAAMIVALRALQSDTTPPTVALTAPASGATVSGSSVAVTASASDNVGVAWVQFQLDGANLGPHLVAAPYTIAWDTTAAANGSHTLGAQASDAAGNVGSAAPVSVTISNAPPPVISNVSASGITTTGATIGWSTDVPASSQVEYGITTAYGSSTALDSTLVTGHSVAVGGLTPAMQYHYRVKSAAPGTALAVSADLTFITATPPPPVISSVAASTVTASTATITWTTDTASDTTVEYGTTTAYGASASTPGLVTSHTQGLIGLSSSTLYHYRVKSKDAYGQVSASADATFTTTTPPPSPPTFRSQSTVTNGRTVSKPSGVVAGDLLLASLEIDADPVTVTAPAGWTLLQDTIAGGGTASVFHGQLWYKVAGPSEPLSYTWTIAGSAYTDIGLLAYTNVNLSAPIDASAGRDAGTTSQPATGAITTNFASDLVVATFVNYQFGTWTAGPGMTGRYDFDSCFAEDVVVMAAGPVSARTATNTTSGPTTAQVVAIRSP